MNYSVTYALLALRYIHKLIRKPRLSAWIKCLVKPVQQKYDEFNLLRIKINRELSYNSQVAILEYLLNKTFNTVDTGIYIDDIADNKEQLFTYFLSESEPPAFIRNISEYNADTGLVKHSSYFLSELAQNYDFIIYIPTALINIETEPKKAAEVTAKVQRYKFAGTRFTIKNY